jgi:fructokinase
MNFFDCTVIGDIFFDIPVKFDFDIKSFFSGGTSYCDFAKPAPGGSGNIAVGTSTLGGKVAFVGKAGNDAFGKLYEQDLKNHGVFPKIFFDNDLPTGLILALVEKKERSFLVSRGANDQLSPSEIEKAGDIIRKSNFLYFCGYSLVHDPQKNAILKAVEMAKKQGARIIFDPGAYNLVLSDRDFFVGLLDVCDVVSLNVDEAKALTRKTDFKDMGVELGKKVSLAVIKCGEEGSLLFKDGDIVRTKGYCVRCTDTTGAGDAFTSALIYGLTRGLPLVQTGQLANWYAAQVVRKIGARSFPSKMKIEDFLRKLNV